MCAWLPTVVCCSPPSQLHEQQRVRPRTGARTKHFAAAAAREQEPLGELGAVSARRDPQREGVGRTARRREGVWKNSSAGMASSPCGNTNFDSGLEIKTRSVEQTLIPLVSQVSIKTSPPSPQAPPYTRPARTFTRVKSVYLFIRLVLCCFDVVNNFFF